MVVLLVPLSNQPKEGTLKERHTRKAWHVQVNLLGMLHGHFFVTPLAPWSNRSPGLGSDSRTNMQIAHAGAVWAENGPAVAFSIVSIPCCVGSTRPGIFRKRRKSRMVQIPFPTSLSLRFVRVFVCGDLHKTSKNLGARRRVCGSGLLPHRFPWENSRGSWQTWRVRASEMHANCEFTSMLFRTPFGQGPNNW